MRRQNLYSGHAHSTLNATTGGLGNDDCIKHHQVWYANAGSCEHLYQQKPELKTCLHYRLTAYSLNTIILKHWCDPVSSDNEHVQQMNQLFTTFSYYKAFVYQQPAQLLVTTTRPHPPRQMTHSMPQQYCICTIT